MTAESVRTHGPIDRWPQFLLALLNFGSMPFSTATLRLAHFWINAHLDDGYMDHGQLFLGAIPQAFGNSPTARVLRTSSKLTRVMELEPLGSKLFMAVFTKQLGDNVSDLEGAAAGTTHIIVDPEHRRAAIEVNRTGFNETDLAQLLESIARQGPSGPSFSSLDLSFNPIFQPDVLYRGIDSFERIVSVSLTISRPNPGWGDHYEKLIELAEESGAAQIELQTTASRGKGLNKNQGVIELARRAASITPAILKRLSFTGWLWGGDELIALNLADHARRTEISVSVLEDGNVDPLDLRHKMAEDVESSPAQEPVFSS